MENDAAALTQSKFLDPLCATLACPADPSKEIADAIQRLNQVSNRGGAHV